MSAAQRRRRRGGGGGGVPKGTVDYLGTFSVVATSTTLTINDVDLGEPDPSRVICIVYHAEGGSANSNNWRRLDSADSEEGRGGVWGAHSGGIYFYTKPTGLTGSFAANFAANKSRMIIAVYALYGYDVSNVDRTSSVLSTNSVTSRSVTIAHPAGNSWTVAQGLTSSTRTITWGSDLSQDGQENFNTYTFTTASVKETASGSNTASISWSGSTSGILRGLVIPEL